MPAYDTALDQAESVIELYGNTDGFLHDIFHGPDRRNGIHSLQRPERYMKA